MYAISWNNEKMRAGTIDEVEALLDLLHERFSNDEPTLVTVERASSGDSLSIGLGLDVSVMNYVRGDKNPPYYTTLGGGNVDKFVSFMFGGEWSEYPLRNAVPLSAARAAMRKFCETGELTTDVAWEEV